jgi:hypothetical protein
VVVDAGRRGRSGGRVGAADDGGRQRPGDAGDGWRSAGVAAEPDQPTGRRPLEDGERAAQHKPLGQPAAAHPQPIQVGQPAHPPPEPRTNRGGIRVRLLHTASNQGLIDIILLRHRDG